MKADHYDSFAESYSRDNESNLFNGYYERPAMIGLAGDVRGRRVLDAGCGSGPLSAALRERGAIVTGLDSSPAMVALARQRLGDDAELFVATSADRFRSTTARTTMSSRRSSCTTCRTGRPLWESCDASWCPAAGSSCR